MQDCDGLKLKFQAELRTRDRNSSEVDREISLAKQKITQVESALEMAAKEKENLVILLFKLISTLT